MLAINIFLFLTNLDCIKIENEVIIYDKNQITLVQDILRKLEFGQTTDIQSLEGQLQLKIKLFVMPRSLIIDQNVIRDISNDPT